MITRTRDMMLNDIGEMSMALDFALGGIKAAQMGSPSKEREQLIGILGTVKDRLGKLVDYSRDMEDEIRRYDSIITRIREIAGEDRSKL